MRIGVAFVLLIGAACSSPEAEPAPVESTGGEDVVAVSGPSFADDVSFLRTHLPDLVVLERGDARVAVAPSYQGRVMTSGASADGASFGWIHRALIESGERTPHMNAFGGEERFWLGPEGGPFALYFPPGAPFEFEHWQVPAAIDTDAWDITAQTETEVSFEHEVTLTNRAGTELTIGIRRTVRVISPEEMGSELDAASRAVAYRTDNAIINRGDTAWTPESGLVSIWLLSMYRPGPATTVVIPFEAGPEAELGPIVNAAYFGEVPPDRLVVDEDRGVIFFRGDGRERGKIGVPRRRARPVMGSWDADAGALTIVAFEPAADASHGYVNSMWGEQEQPYEGDVVNSYNDGPPEPGAEPMGPFYELESSSPAAALGPGEGIHHTQRTLHVVGPRATLDAVANAQLGVGLDVIEAALPR